MKPTYTNDKKAPRMKKAQFATNIISTEAWKRFREKFPEYKNKSDKELRKLWEDIADTIRTESITNPLGVKLGSYTGELKFQYLPYKFNAMNRDEKVTEEVGEKVKYTNIVSRGKVAKIKWERRWAVKFNTMLQFYAFEETRRMNDLSKKHLTENPDKLRVSRMTMGGNSIWRKLK